VSINAEIERQNRESLDAALNVDDTTVSAGDAARQSRLAPLLERLEACRETEYQQIGAFRQNETGLCCADFALAWGDRAVCDAYSQRCAGWSTGRVTLRLRSDDTIDAFEFFNPIVEPGVEPPGARPMSLGRWRDMDAAVEEFFPSYAQLVRAGYLSGQRTAQRKARLKARSDALRRRLRVRLFMRWSTAGLVLALGLVILSVIAAR